MNFGLWTGFFFFLNPQFILHFVTPVHLVKKLGILFVVNLPSLNRKNWNLMTVSITSVKFEFVFCNQIILLITLVFMEFQAEEENLKCFHSYNTCIKLMPSACFNFRISGFQPCVWKTRTTIRFGQSAIEQAPLRWAHMSVSPLEWRGWWACQGGYNFVDCHLLYVMDELIDLSVSFSSRLCCTNQTHS